jgi:tRNA uridine 5-carbamoylmethylation protein Kti12
MKQFLMVICGLPAAGKTALASAVKKALNSDVEIVTSDMWRDEAYYTDWRPEKEGPVRNISLKLVQKLIKQGKSVIHDDTNYYQSMRHDLFRIALEKRCCFTIIHVTTSLETAIQWDRQRKHSNINQDIIRNIAKRFDSPGGRYLWDYPSAEVDMATQDLNSAVAEIVSIIDSLEPVGRQQSTRVTKSKGETIDKITREAVTEFLIEHPELRENKEVSMTRRRVLRYALENNAPIKSVRDIITRELRKLLASHTENKDESL